MVKQTSKHLVILGGLLTAVAHGTAAQATNCTGDLTPGNYDSLIVPAGQNCAVPIGTVTIAGNVMIRTGSLGVKGPAQFTVNGSLLGIGAAGLQIVPRPLGAATILGSVSLTGATDNIVITDSFIGGTLSIASSKAGFVNVFQNNIAGNTLVQGNKTPVNEDAITGNTIGGSLVCAGNTPAPVDGGMPNTVGGSKVGQCSGL